MQFNSSVNQQLEGTIHLTEKGFMVCFTKVAKKIIEKIIKSIKLIKMT